MSNDSKREDSKNHTFDDLLDEQGHLPDVQTTDELVSRLLADVYGQEEDGHSFTEVALTYRPPRGADYETIKNRPSAGGLQYGRVKPAIGSQEFWHPINAPLPVVAFKCKEENGHVERWTKPVHPRLVAAGREEVMKHLASWLYHEIHETTAQLTKLLRWLSVTREEGTLPTTWPCRMNDTPGEEWDVDSGDRVPAVGREEKALPAEQRFDSQ